MPPVTFSEAAAALGFRSRSTLFRLRKAGSLGPYLRPPAGPCGAPLLELNPPDLPPLAEHVARTVRPQANNETRRSRPADPRWEALAAELSDALAHCGGLSLSAGEAATIAAALPAAVGIVFGPAGLERLRQAVADEGCWRAGPCTPADPGADESWWSEWGRWEPGEPLGDGPFWENVAGIVGGMMGGPFEGLSGPQIAELHRQLQEAIGAVEGGARWDARAWAAASARSLLEDPDVAAGQCPYSRPELEQLAAGGLLPPDLQAAVAAALQRGPA